jgi:2-methylcitrate dehydratase PrpD
METDAPERTMIPASAAKGEGPQIQLQRLARWACGLTFEDLPADVVERAKVILMDDLGAILGGSLEPEVTAIRRQRMAVAAPGRSSILAAGLPQVDAYTAAEVNGTAGCWLELDEGYRLAPCHAGVYTVPAALAMAEDRGASGRDLLLALVVAYETVTRFARTYRFPGRVLHPHALLSPIASAAATARLLAHEPETWLAGITSAISLALVGPLRYATGGAFARNLWTGISARSGMLAASYTAAGIGGLPSAPQDAFCDALRGTCEPDEMTRGLGESYAVSSGYHKQFACCQHAHSTLGALLEIRGRRPRQNWAATVTGIQVETHPSGLALTDRRPATTLGAKFSIPHAVAATLVLGTGGLQAFTREALNATEIATVRERVTLAVFEPILPWPNDRPARVTVRLQDGSVETATCINAPGDPVTPLSMDCLRAKFTELAEDALGSVDATRIIAAIFDLDRGGPVSELRESMGRPVRAT